MNRARIAVYLVFGLLIVGYVVALAATAKECTARHGHLVRGVVWYECVSEDGGRNL